jgi:hypothetical protein
MISLSNISFRIKPSITMPISSSNLLENTFILSSNKYYNPGYPNPRTPETLPFSNFSNFTVSTIDAAPAGWIKIPRKLAFLDLGGNTWKANDYWTMVARYPVNSFFYLVYKGRFLRLRFNGAESPRIRNTSFWHSTDGGNTWNTVTDSSWINLSPDGQTINGQFINWNEPYLSMVEVFPPALLDRLSTTARSNCVAAYAMKRLSSTYLGPTVKLIRASDNTQMDFYADVNGNLMTGLSSTGTTLSSWLSGTSANIVTWYDQTGRGKDVSVSTATRPAIITGDSNAVHLTSSTLMSASNLFDTTTVSAMHLISTTREKSRGQNYLISLNGTVTDINRFTIHMPWSDGVWYWDPWGGNAENRAQSTANITTVDTKSIFSGYKGGFRVNRGTTFTSTGNTPNSVAGGLRIGAYNGSLADHYMYNMIVFSSRLSAADETIVETNI